MDQTIKINGYKHYELIKDGDTFILIEYGDSCPGFGEPMPEVEFAWQFKEEDYINFIWEQQTSLSLSEVEDCLTRGSLFCGDDFVKALGEY